MSFEELFDSNIKNNLVNEIQTIDLSCCSNMELIALRSWATKVKQHADILTLEDEIVGYTYYNLDAITPKIVVEESKRGMQLVKTTRKI